MALGPMEVMLGQHYLSRAMLAMLAHHHLSRTHDVTSTSNTGRADACQFTRCSCAGGVFVHDVQMTCQFSRWYTMLYTTCRPVSLHDVYRPSVSVCAHTSLARRVVTTHTPCAHSLATYHYITQVKLGDVGAGRLANIAHFAPISRIFFLSLRTP